MPCDQLFRYPKRGRTNITKSYKCEPADAITSKEKSPMMMRANILSDCNSKSVLIKLIKSFESLDHKCSYFTHNVSK